MAKRLIDSAELIAKLPIVKEDKQISLIGAVADVVTMISECQPVDAVEVCYCKDCKNYTNMDAFNGNRLNFHWCSISRNIMSEDDFCSYGERREEADHAE